MKKRIIALLLSALLLANVTACNTAPETNDESTLEDTHTAESTVEETEEETTEVETSTEKKPPRKSPGFYNGVRVWGNSKVTYTFHQNGEFSLHIADWDEDHLVTFLSDKDMNYVTAVSVNNERAFLLLKRYYETKITVISFEKGSQSETVVNLDVDEGVFKISGNFINENVGYLFAFKEVSEGAVGSSKLSNLYKTEDGGKTWNSIDVQNVPSISLRNHLEFAKMISEDVGLISGNIFAADYDFCRRTLLTTDGGLNWIHVNIPELPQEDDLQWAKVADFTQVDGSYILTIRYGTPEGTHVDAKYKLIDSNTWVRIS